MAVCMHSTVQILANFRIMSRWIDAQHEMLLSKFKYRWIAVMDKKVVDNDKNIGRLKRRLETKYGKDYQDTIVLDYVSDITTEDMILVS